MIVRILYEKLGPVCFVPHVEMPTLFSRSMRRAGIRQTFTEGMSPHPKISLGPPLPVGCFPCASWPTFGLTRKILLAWIG